MRHHGVLYWTCGFFVLLHLTTTLGLDFSVRIFPGSQDHIPAKDSKHFVIIITSYNNRKWCLSNIERAFSQQYDNFEIMFVDDCSNDGTADLVVAAIKRRKPSCKITVVTNYKRCGALQNIYRTIAWCDDNDIIVSLDGDDWFPHNHVLTKLNAVYANSAIWMTHGQFKRSSDGKINAAAPIPAHVMYNNSYRKHPDLPTHLRTFYVWLFRQVKLADLLYEGQFFVMTWDAAFMLPMIELSGVHHVFINEVMYVYNDTNPINDGKVNQELQNKLEHFIRAKKPYLPLDSPVKGNIPRSYQENREL